jgi:hypothetical protein
MLEQFKGHVPQFADYLQSTLFPDVILIADWIAARLKDKQGLSGITMDDLLKIYAELQDIKNKFPQINWKQGTLSTSTLQKSSSIQSIPTTIPAPVLSDKSGTVTIEQQSGPVIPVSHKVIPTPAFTVNFVPTPDGKTHGIKQGDDIIVKNQTAQTTCSMDSCRQWMQLLEV